MYRCQGSHSSSSMYPMTACNTHESVVIFSQSIGTREPWSALLTYWDLGALECLVNLLDLGALECLVNLLDLGALECLVNLLDLGALECLVNLLGPGSLRVPC